MLTLIPRHILQKTVFSLLIVVGIFSLVCAQEQNDAALFTRRKVSPVKLSIQEEQARMYRSQGYQLQSIGNLDAAMSLYQKAIQLDPTYAIAYNDMGVIYEAKGNIDNAEQAYLRAIKIDSMFLSSYTNLAFLCESKRDLEKAAYYWKKRISLGSASDPWTKKASQRLKDIQAVLAGKGGYEQGEAIELMQDVAFQKALNRSSDRELANDYFRKAKRNYATQDYASAFKHALNAKQLDPTNSEIDEFIGKVQIRALSK